MDTLRSLYNSLTNSRKQVLLEELDITEERLEEMFSERYTSYNHSNLRDKLVRLSQIQVSDMESLIKEVNTY